MNEKEHEILSERLMKIIKKYAYDKDVREELHTYLICQRTIILQEHVQRKCAI